MPNCRRVFSKALEFPVITACPLYNWEYHGDVESIDNVTTIANLEEQFVNLVMFDEYGNS